MSKWPLIQFLLTGTIASLLGCNSTPVTQGVTAPPQTSVPYMDLLAYRSQLIDARGQLPQPQTSCAMDLRIRPSLRDEVLKDGHDYDWFLSDSQYSSDSKQADAVWGQGQRSGIQSEEARIQGILNGQGKTASPWQDTQARSELSQFGLYPGFYDLNSYASYQVGPVQMPWYQPDGYVYKVFFEFKDPQGDLTADRYLEFSKQLQAAGFQGDSKVPLMPGWERFYWNGLIVHAPTTDLALVAERVGLAYFGSLLSSHSRGVDVSNSLTGGKALDWPDFLCAVDPVLLPAAVLQYVKPGQ